MILLIVFVRELHRNSRLINASSLGTMSITTMRKALGTRLLLENTGDDRHRNRIIGRKVRTKSSVHPSHEIWMRLHS